MALSEHIVVMNAGARASGFPKGNPIEVAEEEPSWGAGTYKFGTGATLVNFKSPIYKAVTYRCEANTKDEALRGAQQAFPGWKSTKSFCIKVSSGEEK